ncbi:PepSY domain-containing protein [Spirosoma sp. KNUC1025]|uniref:PepSY domain-containing protein n=1 Tax=Spirosoma sp. KNUC1025 TaxID=2894082 RepID=UPI001E57A749|nr:PepSY domain-containing protein [Spirosoma sp. KNUC1025]UFH57747.1 PepSY domain-containing protein [Spirosoma sp. KNUC1025]
MKQYYPLIRALHLFTGLFISPFVIIFCLSVLAFNHVKLLNSLMPVKLLPIERTKLDRIPRDTSDLLTAKAIIQKLGITGEIDFISSNDNHISFPVIKPGLRTKIDVDTRTDSVTITRQEEGWVRATSYLHSMPGQHNARLRGNSVFLTIWKVMADSVVYLLLWLTVSGVLLWWCLKVERPIGITAIVLGVLLFSGLLLLIF